MKSIIERMEKYLDKKSLKLNVGKTKVMRFREGRGRMSKMNWSWRGKRTEEVKEFKYLEYTLQRNGRQEVHMRERIAKAVTDQIWGRGKRRFGRN